MGVQTSDIEQIDKFAQQSGSVITMVQRHLRSG